MTPRYPNVTVNLTSIDGNPFMILGSCQQAAREAGLSQAVINEFLREATQGDYELLLRTAALWFSCE
jgi:hypothetical protein